ncbi:VOC family protein [Streptomyces sp. NPDC001315]|uniref:VOC family protein n=1 Tax=Streptomyces sp. NPDC001315 TaxID=3364562 RepID=UPI00367FC12C
MSPTRLSTVVLDTRDAHELAGFYQRLLGYEVRADEPDWVLIGPPPGIAGTALSFQTEPEYVPPVWPTRNPGEQQMMLHLDIEVDDLEAETARAVAEGARLAAHQPQDDVRVLFDPSGHPFCLWAEQSE